MSSMTRQVASIETYIAILTDPSLMPKPSQRRMLIDDARVALATMRNEALRQEREGKPS